MTTTADYPALTLDCLRELHQHGLDAAPEGQGPGSYVLALRRMLPQTGQVLEYLIGGSDCWLPGDQGDPRIICQVSEVGYGYDEYLATVYDGESPRDLARLVAFDLRTRGEQAMTR